MSSLAAIISYTIGDPKEKLNVMLQGSNHQHQHCQLALGSQESLVCTESHVIAFSGKLYHKKDPKQKDAEAILCAYKERGKDCFEKLDGKFSFLLFDKAQGALYAVRDQLGLSSLYWYQDRNVTLIATSLKALMQTGQIPRTPDLSQLAAYFSQGFVSQDATPIHHVNRLLPGYYLKVEQDTHLTIHPFWSFSSSFTHEASVGMDFSSEVYREIQKAIKDAIKSRLEISQKPIATLPSELGAYLLATAIPQETRAPKFSPSLSAQDFLQSLVPIVWAQELPNANIDSVRHYYFLKHCAEKKVCYFADSGFTAEFENYAQYCPTTIQQTAPHTHSWLKHLYFYLFPNLAFKELKKRIQPWPQANFFESEALLPTKELKRAAPALHKFFDINLFIQQFYNLKKLPTVSASLFYLNIKTRMSDFISESRMRLAEYFGVDCYSPFLDLKLLQFLASLNPNIWASPDILPSFPASWLHKEHATPIGIHLPMTPSIPHTWLGTKEWDTLVNILHSGSLVKSGYVSARWLQDISKGPPESYVQKLFAIAILEVWMRIFIEQPIESSAPTIFPCK